MARFINEIVDVDLYYGSEVLSSTQFDIPLIIATHNSTENVTDVFTSAKDAMNAGFSVDSPVYKMLDLLFQGVSAPGQVVVGRRPLSAYQVATTALGGAIYTVTLKMGTEGKVFTYTAPSTVTVQNIAEGVRDLIDADSTWSTRITATVDASNRLILTPVAGFPVDVSIGSNMTLARLGAQVNNPTEDITNIAASNNDWFWMISDSHINEDILAFASYAETNDKVYLFSSQDDDVRNNVSGNILQQLAGLAYDNTCMVLWYSTADTTFPEAGLVGAMADVTPGTSNAHGKQLEGVPAEKVMTTTQERNIVVQNGNIYRREHGANFYRDGRMVSGQYLDLVTNSLYNKARTDESVFGLIRRQSMLGSGVRNTQKGRDQIYQAIWADVIAPGISNGTIANEIETSESTGLTVDLRPKITIPSRVDASQSSIDERLLDGVVIEYVYTGFINYVKIRINVLTNRTAVA